MNNRKISFLALIFFAFIQWYIPAKMIFDREDVMETGTDYRFLTTPVDPNDPFRGKFINLAYQENSVQVSVDHEWVRGEKVYVSVMNDSNGFAKIKSVSKERLTDKQDYFEAKIRFVTSGNFKKLTIDYPFDRFYMEESKADEAELTYIHAQNDTSKVTYAIVSVKNGEAVLKDVLINGMSIREIVKQKQEVK